jgi:hypothetical protein
MLTKLHASKKVYDIVDGIIKKRLAGGASRDDTLQMLIDHGDEKLVIVGVNTYRCITNALNLLIFSQFVMGLLVAGARSTGTTGQSIGCRRDAGLLTRTQHRGWSHFWLAIPNGS